MRQRVVPLNRPVTKFGNAPLAGGPRPSRSPPRASTIRHCRCRRRSVRDAFALAQFQELSDDEKLTRPAFETQDAGLQFGVEEAAYQYEALLDTAIDYETLIIDPTRPAEKRDRALCAAAGGTGRGGESRRGRAGGHPPQRLIPLPSAGTRRLTRAGETTMPDPTPAPTYRLFSWLRQGLLAGMTNATDAATPAHPAIWCYPIRLRINNRAMLMSPFSSTDRAMSPGSTRAK